MTGRNALNINKSSGYSERFKCNLLTLSRFHREGGFIGHKSRNSLHQQVYKRLQSMCGFGRSKQQDKTLNVSNKYIYSFSTMQSYMKHCNRFVQWCKETDGIRSYLGHKPHTLDECEQFVEAFIRHEETRGMSAYTVKLEKAALSKMYQKDFSFSTIRTARSDIHRSRNEVAMDKHFSEKNNSEMINACRCIGFRRSELEKAKASDLVQIGEYWFIKIVGKGGKVRLASIIGSDDEVTRAVAYVKSLTGKNHVHSAADIHSYRADYATRVYLSKARPINDLKGAKLDYTELTGKYAADGSRIYKSAVYICRNDKKGVKLDRLAMLYASQQLGHNRESVVGEHYIKI